MPLIYIDADHTYEDLNKLRKYNICSECGEYLSIFRDGDGKVFLACHEWPRSHHEGIEREASPFEQTGIESLNIEARRKIMTEQIGEEKTTALDKYMGVTSLTRDEAKEILRTVYPDAPETEMARAMILCANYGLNPLMGHVFLIPFKKKDKAGKVIGESWATVMGIKATRLLGNRKGAVSYTDDTPRLMTRAEQEKIYGKVQEGQICAITKCKDPATGAEVSGYGKWRVGDTFQGGDKGNSPENMAFIRSERQALDRLRPGEMPEQVEVMDERYIPKVEAPVIEAKAEAPPGAIDAESKVVEGPALETQPDAAAAGAFKAPVPNSLDDLLMTMRECNWQASELGQFINVTKGWKMAMYGDLNADQIKETIAYIKANPK